jgi:hypothetical protein
MIAPKIPSFAALSHIAVEKNGGTFCGENWWFRTA